MALSDNIRRVIFVFMAVCLLAIPVRVGAVVNTHAYVDGYAGARIDTWNGNLYYSRTDLNIPARSLSIDISMSYNLTRRNEDRGFGYGWQLSYDMSYRNSGSDVIIRWGHGRDDKFTGGSVPPTGSYDTLNTYGSGYLLTTKHGTKYYFDAAGHQKITRIENSEGDSLTFTYTGTQLTRITDTHGRYVTLAWSGGRLSTVTDANTSPARTISYQYDSGKLTRVTDPMGKYISYGYFTGHDGSYILNTITDRNGNYFTINYYYESPDGYFVKSMFNGPDEIVIDYYVNGNYRSIRYLLNEALQKNVTHYYDAKGKLTGTNSESQDWDSQNNVTRRTDENSNTTIYSYDTKGNLLREYSPLVNGVSYSTRYTYNPAFNKVATRTDARGNTTGYQYDSQGRQTRVTDALGNNTLYSYDTNNDLLRETNAKGIITRYSYNAYGNRIKMIQDSGGMGLITSNSYDNVGNLTAVKDPRGKTTAYTYDKLNRRTQAADALGNSTLYSYDGNGSLLRTTDAGGRITRQRYNSWNLRTKVIDALLYSTTYEYDFIGNLVKQTDSRLNSTRYTYAYATCSACGKDRLVGVTDAEGDSTLYSHDPMGNVLKVTDGEGKIIRYTYDALNRRTRETKVKSGGNAVTFYYYDGNNNLTTVTDANGNSTVYSYDALNRQLRMTNALGENERYSYDAVGNKIKVISANGNTTLYSHDNLNRLLRVSDSLGTIARYAYDANGNRTSETDANSNTTAYTYDDTNRLTQVTDAMSNSTIYSYDKVGNRLRVTDREGKITRYAYDAVNRLVTETKDSGGLNIATTYEYDGVGNRTKITDDNGNATSYTYDKVNRLTRETYADPTKVVDYTYDRVGNRASRRDQNGNYTYYTYDDLHRLTLRDYPGSNDDSFTYDLGGRMLTADNGISSVRYTYDAINRVTQERQNGKMIGYVHSTVARTRQITYPGGRVILETRDVRGRLATVTEGASTIAGYSYTGGRLDTIAYLNGTTATYSYNANNWITGLSHYHGGTRIAEFGYGFDKEGNRKYAERFHDTGNSEQYIYDNVYRLATFRRGTLNGSKEIPVPVTQTAYTLDGVGNWDSKVTDGATETRTHNILNQITVRNGTSLNYDANGNLTDDGAKTYEYDYENRLTRAKIGVVTLAEFKYDALGRRIEKTAGGTTTKYYLDGDRVIEEQASGATTATYVYGDWIDAMLAMTRGGNTYYYHPNSLGSIDALTDNTGAVVEYYRYDAYGTASVYNAGWVYQGTASTVGNPYMFTGRELDNATGLYYYRARYYSPTLGRFMQHDPLGYVDGMNLYEYVKGNPITYIDSFGKNIICQETSREDVPLLQDPNNRGEFIRNYFVDKWRKIREDGLPLNLCACIWKLVGRRKMSEYRKAQYIIRITEKCWDDKCPERTWNQTRDETIYQTRTYDEGEVLFDPREERTGGFYDNRRRCICPDPSGNIPLFD